LEFAIPDRAPRARSFFSRGVMRILTIETTCDETAVAVATDEPSVVASIVASQHPLHDAFGGVVPEIAARAHVRQIVPAIAEALRGAGVSLAEVDAVAVAAAPGLPGSLAIGLTAAKTLAMALDVPLVAVNHLEAHIYACRPSLWSDRTKGLEFPHPLADGEIFPCVALVVSGGHTSLYACQSALQIQLLGATTDDAAGEAFDKVAQLLGLGYPGGPAIQKAAEGGNPRAFRLPRAFLHEPRLDFSFSGLKTAVLYGLASPRATGDSEGPIAGTPLDLSAIRRPVGQELADWAASFQEAVVEVLVEKCRLAIRGQQATRLCVGGGVAANRWLRESLIEMARQESIELVIPPISLCTDNAAMLALAVEKLRRGQTDPLDMEANPRPQRQRA
jgi:N6-L-threonylcarbamoyladenine synthase